MSKVRAKFKMENGKVIYPRPIHSQELAKGDMPNSETIITGKLRKKSALRVAARTL